MNTLIACNEIFSWYLGQLNLYMDRINNCEYKAELGWGVKDDAFIKAQWLHIDNAKEMRDQMYAIVFLANMCRGKE